MLGQVENWQNWQSRHTTLWNTQIKVNPTHVSYRMNSPVFIFHQFTLKMVLFKTRIQKERFSSNEAYEEACKNYVVNDKTMHHAKARMAVLHPLPR